MSRTPLHDEHLALGAHLTEFAGWQMPVRYESALTEHAAVRSAAGLFDVSHMAEISVRGAQAAAGLDAALVSGMERLLIGRAKYTMLCTPSGGVIDDLIVYRRDWDHFVVVANAGNREVVAQELQDRLAAYEAEVTDISEDVALLAVQGPASTDIVADMCVYGAEDVRALRPFRWCTVLLEGDVHAWVARTGYTGEVGYEIFTVAADAVEVWRLALAAGEPRGLLPCGLAARDTLRLEAGMPLYGQELTRDTTPYDAGLGWVVQTGDAPIVLPPGLDGAVSVSDEPQPRGEFVGREALASSAALHAAAAEDPGAAAESARVLVGLAGGGKRAGRAGYPVMHGARTVGFVTSGAPSPSLGQPIAMAMVHPSVAAPGTHVDVDVRGRAERMTVVALPFYSRGA